MADVHSKDKRSYNMSMIKAKWTKQEKIVHNYLKGRKIKHRMHPFMDGNPDILIKGHGAVIFLDGCFWHKCPECFRKPQDNGKFWAEKIDKNVLNDRKNTEILEKNGWKVLRIWEHDIRKNLGEALLRIESLRNK